MLSRYVAYQVLEQNQVIWMACLSQQWQSHLILMNPSVLLRGSIDYTTAPHTTAHLVLTSGHTHINAFHPTDCPLT